MRVLFSCGHLFVWVFFREGIIFMTVFFMWFSFAWVFVREISFFVSLFCRAAIFS